MSGDCRNICAFHQERDELIKSIQKEINDNIGPALNQHKGYWKLFFIGVTLSIFIIGMMVSSIQRSAESMSQSVNALRAQVTEGRIDHSYNAKRLDNQRKMILEIGERLRAVEREVE